MSWLSLFCNEGKKAKGALKIELWRRYSPVSIRHIFIKALTHFNTVNNVILLGNPVLEKYELKQIPIQQIESLVDGWIKGNFFLIKELLTYFSQNGSKGNIAFVCQNYDSKPSCSLNEVLRRSFIGLATSLLADAYELEKDRGIVLNGFDSFQGSEADYADFIVTALQDKASKLSGKWFKQHSGIISRLTKR